MSLSRLYSSSGKGPVAHFKTLTFYCCIFAECWVFGKWFEVYQYYLRKQFAPLCYTANKTKANTSHQGQSPLQFLLFSRVIGKLHTFFNTLSEKKVAEFPVIFSWNDITQNTFGFFLLGGCRHFMTNFQLSGRAFQHSTFRKNNLFDFTLSVKHNLSQALLRLTLSMNYQCVRCEVNTVSYKLSILLFKQTS